MIDQLIAYSGSRRPNLLRSFAIVAVLFGALALVRPGFLRPDVTPNFDGHALASLDMAATRAWCAEPSGFSNQYRAPFYVRDHPEARHRSMRQLMIDQAGSLDQYCASIDQKFVNNENSLMVVEIALLKARPDMSYVQVVRSLRLIHLVLLWFVAFAMLELGASVWMAALALLLGVDMLNMISDHVASAYPWLFVLVSATAAFYALCAQRRFTRLAPGLVLVGLAAGAVSAFGTNMRTSYLPVYVAMFVLFALGSERGLALEQPRPRAGHARRLAALAVAFVAGFIVWQYTAITRHIPDGLVYNSSQHSVAHPLVLAIGVPESDFSRSQGIRWMDSIGGQLALRVDPKAEYLGPNYDQALFTLYRQLWSSHPREMAGVYWEKARVAGKHMLMILRGGPGWNGMLRRRLLTPLDWLPSGIWIATFYVVLVALAARQCWRRGTPAMLFAALLSVAGLLLYVESAVIMSLYVPNYHNYSAFLAMLVCLAIAQSVVNFAWTRVLGPRLGLR